MGETPDAPWRPTRPELAVLASGTATMGLEILAGRIVAPEFGSSIYTWGSVIGVFLAALSLGYHRGGRRAEDNATVGRLAVLLLGSAAYVGFLLLAGDLLLRASARVPVPARFAPLVPVTVLFGPPVYLLGFITPYAAELSVRDGTGEASGRVFALGTLGSITGAFATTFVLVPALSIELIGLLFGGLLVATAARIATPLSRDVAVRLLVVGVLLVAGASGGSIGLRVSGDPVYRTGTPYQQLEVVDRGDVRTLYLDGQPHSAMDLNDPDRHVFDHTRYFHLPLLMTEDVDRVLFVGGGGFTGPKHFAREYDVQVDVVEIDPVVVRTAERYFRLEETDDLRVHVADGREYLEGTNRTYDLIVLDAYRKDKVPFHLTTVEFMRLASERLDEDGVVLANVISAPSGPGSKFLRAEYRTMARVFPQVYAFPTSQTNAVQNVELVATKSPEPVTEATLQRRNRRRDVGVDLREEIDFYRRDVRTADVPVLRDGKAPVDRLLDPMLGRRYVVERTGNGSARTAPAAPGGPPVNASGDRGVAASVRGAPGAVRAR